MVESRHILNSVIAGLVGGVVGAAIEATIPYDRYIAFIKELLEKQLEAYNLSPREVSQVINSTLSVFSATGILLYLSPIINMVIIALFLGIILDVLSRRINAKLASILTGLLMIGLSTAPFFALAYTYKWFVSLILEYFGYWPVIVPSIAYMAALIVLSSIHGPWTKWGEAKPEKY